MMKSIRQQLSRYSNKLRVEVSYVKSISIEETTFKRLTSIMTDNMHTVKRDLTYDEVVNELIDVYQEYNWGAIGTSAGGG
jgi:hypothetical protein